MENLIEQVKVFILEELSSDSEESITTTTPLLSSGIIDSISALQLVEFLENTFGIEFQAHEVDQDNLDTLEKIESFVKGKLIT